MVVRGEVIFGSPLHERTDQNSPVVPDVIQVARRIMGKTTIMVTVRSRNDARPTPDPADPLKTKENMYNPRVRLRAQTHWPACLRGVNSPGFGPSSRLNTNANRDCFICGHNDSVPCVTMIRVK
ncbi:hypothetical protein Bbelb_138640 [Branchiostoma belcheri]|nr:hypothetical protein Bbelb_138640 [Branchiostoma belcheri]